MFGNENLKGELYVDFKGFIKTKDLLTEVKSLTNIQSYLKTSVWSGHIVTYCARTRALTFDR